MPGGIALLAACFKTALWSQGTPLATLFTFWASILMSEAPSQTPSSAMEMEKVKVDSGEQRLRELGYKQELKRELSLIHNLALSFSIICILGAVTVLYNTGLSYGGPVSMTYGWLIVSFFSMFVGVSLAEICSAYPTTGGLYFWSYQLAGKEWGPFAAWMTGWFNIVAQWAAIASIDYYLAVFIQTIILLSTGGANNGGYIASKYEVLGICGGILLLHSALNSLPIGWLAYVGTFAAAWNILGVFILMFLIPLVSPTRASAKFVFQHFNKESSYQIHSSPYIFCLGLLMSQFTLAGYDAAAHMSEEAKFSDKSGPYTIISSLAISIVVGWGYLLGITFAVTDLDHVIDPGNDANGNAIAQVFYDAFKNRFGSGIGGIFCLGVVALAVFFSAMGAITATSRIIYGFSRDEAMPFSRVWHSVNRWEVPLNAVWLCTTISFILATTSLGSLVAFQALVSVATISIYITYAVPSLLRVTIARKSFVSGPLKLGVFGSICGWVAVMWVAVITVLFSLPVQYPVTSKNLNYAPVVVGGVAALGIGSWLVNARHWFKGPVANLAAHEH